MPRNAFVKIIESERGLFFQVCYTDEEGKLWNLLDPMDYPFFWGFQKMEHALRVAQNHNSIDENEWSNRELALTLSNVERPGSKAIESRDARTWGDE